MKFKNLIKDDIIKASGAAIVMVLVSVFVLAIGNSYAFTPYTITFNNNYGNKVMKTCQTDVNGKLDNDCITTISTICKKWSPNYKNSSEGQTIQIPVTDFSNMTFSTDTNYYCVGGTSGTYDMGCYVCKTDDSIMHWAANGNSNELCSSGYVKSTEITDEASCKVDKPLGCYVCKNDNNIMKWDNDDTSDSDCSSGYIKSTEITDEASCKVEIPMSCYVCNDNDKIMKWDNNGNIDNECASGYTISDYTYENCPPDIPDENPKTGSILIAIVWVIGLASLYYALSYFRNSKNN